MPDNDNYSMQNTGPELDAAVTFGKNPDTVPTQNSLKGITSGAVYAALAGKQNTLTFDNAPTSGSNNPVKSGGIYTALQGKQNTLTFDNTPTQNSNNPVKSSGIYTALAGKQSVLTFDNAPTSGSSNPVKSGGVYTALAGKQNTLTFDNAPTENSNNPVKSGGVYSALQGKQDALTIDSYPQFLSNNPVKSGGVYPMLLAMARTSNSDVSASAIPKGAFVWVQGILYRATSDIGSGQSISANASQVNKWLDGFGTGITTYESATSRAEIGLELHGLYGVVAWQPIAGLSTPTRYGIYLFHTSQTGGVVPIAEGTDAPTVTISVDAGTGAFILAIEFEQRDTPFTYCIIDFSRFSIDSLS